MSASRFEKDSMGSIAVPKDALYAAQTQRAVLNFPVSGMKMPDAFIRSLLLVKKAAANTNARLDVLPKDVAAAICKAVEQLLADERLMDHFPVDVFQTGSGTSTNMNANEVLANLVSRKLDQPVSPNDHINCGQSSNDVIPTTIHVSAVMALENDLLPSLRHLAHTVRDKAGTLENYIKTGRTHLMDAMPVKLSQSVGAWASQVEGLIKNLEYLKPDLAMLAQGGTAVGTGINCHPKFAEQFCIELNRLTGQRFVPADDFFARIGSQDTAVALSGQLKTAAVTLMKIANDLRWMNSGPLSGLAEIELEALQPGSSIMPSKVNPVIPEAVAMVAAQVIGNDAAITVAGQSGNFELNVMLPLIAHNLLQSLALLSSSCRLLADRAIATFKINEENLRKALAMNPILATALNPVVGYMKAAEIAKTAYQQKRPVIEVAQALTDLDEQALKALLDPANLTGPNLQ